MSYNDIFEFSQIWTEYLTDSDKSQLRPWKIEWVMQVWERIPDNIKKIVNAIWEVEKYCFDFLNPSDEKGKLLEGKLGNMPNIRYLLDTNTDLSDEEKDAIAWKDSNQTFYGWEWWNRYFTENWIIKLSRAHFEESSEKTIAEVQRRFTYIHV